MNTRAAVLFAALIACPAAADIAPEPLVTGGNTMAPREKGVPVEMAWEEVDIHPSAAKNRVTAVFALRNTGDQAVKFEVGFPSYNRIALKDFAVEVDGRPQAAAEKKEGDGSERHFLCWMCWEMEFAAKQERQVKVSYWVPTEHIYSHLEYESLPDDLKATVWPYETGYVLRTGVGWKGNIGKATIRLHYGEEVKKANTRDLRPDLGWTYDGKADVDTLVLKDFEPEGDWFDICSYDVSFQFTMSGPRQEVDLLLKAAKEKRLDPWALQFLLEWIEKGGNPRRIEDLEDEIYGEEEEDLKRRLTKQLELEASALPLSEEERKRLILETLECMVPPGGPEFDQDAIGPGAENIVQEAYHRLFSHFVDVKATEKAVAVGRHYQAFLEVILERDKKWKDKEDYKAAEADHERVVRFLKENAGSAK